MRIEAFVELNNTSMLIGGDEIDVEFNLQTGDIKKRVFDGPMRRKIYLIYSNCVAS